MTDEPRLTDDEKAALLERERARMSEPGYRESLIQPPPGAEIERLRDFAQVVEEQNARLRALFQDEDCAGSLP